MLSKDITDLLSIDYRGLFKDQHRCFELLTKKRDSGDDDIPPELTNGPIFNLSDDLFVWVAQQHIDNGSVNLVASDLMSNISAQPNADLSTGYTAMIEMIAVSGHAGRAAQLRLAHVAGHMDVYREFFNAWKTFERFEALSDGQRKKAPLNPHKRAMAKEFPQRKSTARDAIKIFESWLQKYELLEDHQDQIASWLTELETGIAPKPPVAEKTPMTDKLFWEIIDGSQRGS
jgi:hypothetical protein